MWCPLVFEFETVSGSTDAITTPIDHDDAHFSLANTSTNWQIEDVRMVADIVTLDSGLQNNYADHALSV